MASDSKETLLCAFVTGLNIQQRSSSSSPSSHSIKRNSISNNNAPSSSPLNYINRFFSAHKERVETHSTIEILFGKVNSKSITSNKPLLRWNVVRSYNEIRTLCDYIKKHRYSYSNRKLIEKLSLFPMKDIAHLNGNAEDVLALVEYQEIINAIIQEVIKSCDILHLHDEPLSRFFDIHVYMPYMIKSIRIIQRFCWKCISKYTLAKNLYNFYGKDLILFKSKLLQGIVVYEVSLSETVYHYNEKDATFGFASRKTISYKSKPIKQVMWLDVSDDMAALSRICIATKQVYESTHKNQDGRLANGIFVGDIAEVRLGAASYSFARTQCSWVNPTNCIVIVGSERCLSLQLPDESTDSHLTRIFIVDMLRLLVIKSLTPKEILLRQKSQWLPTSKYTVKRSVLKQQNSSEARHISHLFSKGIPIVEEIFNRTSCTLVNRSRLLKYDEDCHVLSFTANSSNDGDEEHDEYEKHIDIDDISEIRPGKLSYSIDGLDIGMITIVASECIVCLPIDINQRNELIKKFQLFLNATREVPYYDNNVPRAFRPKKTSVAVRRNGSGSTDATEFSPMKERHPHVSSSVLVSITSGANASNASTGYMQTFSSVTATRMNSINQRLLSASDDYNRDDSGSSSLSSRGSIVSMCSSNTSLIFYD